MKQQLEHPTNENLTNLKPAFTPQHHDRILIIDDDPDATDSIKYIIETYSQSRCHVVHDAFEALNALAEKHYDLVFVDQKMPGLYGTKLLQELDHYINQDPLISDSSRYQKPLETILMSGSKIVLPKDFKLENFKLINILDKRQLPKFLAQKFAS